MSDNQNLSPEALLEANVHFGHLKSKWNPKMAPYIFAEQNGIHIIDVKKTVAKLKEAQSAAKNIAKSGRKILFVATKKQAKEVLEAEAKRANMPFVSERWLGGMLTNFATVRKSIKKMQNIDKMKADGTFEKINKKERLMLSRDKEKLNRVLGGIEDMIRTPAALFVVDIKREHIAIKEAQKLNIPIFGLVDTNSDPTQIDFPIPANDDSSKSIALLVREFSNSLVEGLQERQKIKDQNEAADKVAQSEKANQEA